MKKAIVYMFVSAALVTAQAQAQDQDSLGHGLPTVLFNSTDFTRPESSTGVDAQINHDTGTTMNDYAKFWCGYIKAPATGEITITAEADNGLRLAVKGKLTIDGWAMDGAREGKVAAKEGEYLPVQLEYFQDGGDAAFCRLYWQWEGHEKELIPASAYFHDQKDKDVIDKLKNGEAQVTDVRNWQE